MKIRNGILTILLVLTQFQTVFSHPWKPNAYLIVDTDGGIDDFRTLNLLLSSPAVRILGITCSNGVLAADETNLKLTGLLNKTNHQGILTAVNQSQKSLAKNCKTALNFDWGFPVTGRSVVTSHLKMIRYILDHCKEPIIFLNLGSLNTMNSCIEEIPDLKKRLKEVIWMADPVAIDESFNYKIDTNAYLQVIKKQIDLTVINGGLYEPGYTDSFVKKLSYIKNVHAELIRESFIKINSPYLMTCYDEMGALYLHFPDYFLPDTVNSLLIAANLTPFVTQELLDKSFLKILEGKTINTNQVFSAFPDDTLFYVEDIRPNVVTSIDKYGTDEWNSCVMTMELHRHVGVYALIGAKMGVRAREYFGAGVDELNVITYAGLTPPFSCLNDGLQVSTGATLGHGLIRVAENNIAEPKAEFEYLGQKIIINLKEEYRNRIKQEIKEARMLFGLGSNEYWDLVRQYAISYWKNWNRLDIFEIEKENDH